MRTGRSTTQAGKHRGRNVIAALLAAEMAFGGAWGAIMPTVVLADETPQAVEGTEPKGKIIIKSLTTTVGEGEGATDKIVNKTNYIAFRVFTATIAANNQDNDTRDYATDVAWASEGAKKAVIDFLSNYGRDENGSSYTKWLKGSSHEDPQNALEFISERIKASDGTTIDNDTDYGPVDYTVTDKSGNKGKISYTEEYKDGDETKTRTIEEDVYSKKGSSFALALAKHLYNWNKDHADTNLIPIESITANEQKEAREGFYLIAAVNTDINETNPSEGDPIDEAGTAPIWVAIGGHDKEITEKSALTTFNKKVVDDRYMSDVTTIQGVPNEVEEGASQTYNVAAAWTKVADSNISQDLWYRLDGSVPKNIDSYSTYHYRFDDVMADGMNITLTLAGGTDNAETSYVDESKLVTDGVHVVLYKAESDMDQVTDLTSFASPTRTIGETENAVTYLDITNKIATDSKSFITYAEVAESDAAGAPTHRTLTVNIDDLRTIAGNDFTVDKNTHVAVYYQAHLDNSDLDKVVYGKGEGKVGNRSTATLTYTGDPIDTADKTLSSQSTSTYTYQLQVTKHDKSNGSLLANAKFAIRVTDGEYTRTLVDGENTTTDTPKNTDPMSSGKFVNKKGELVTVEPEELRTLAANNVDGRKAWANAHNGETQGANESDPPKYDAAKDLVFTTGDGTGDTTLGQLPIIRGLDEGIYVIEELETPKGNQFGVYQLQDAPIVLTITSMFSDAELANADFDTQNGFKASVSGGETTSVNDRWMVTRIGWLEDVTEVTGEGEDETTVITRRHFTDSGRYGVHATTADHVDYDATTNSNGVKASYGVTVEDGLIKLMTVDDRALVMPITGMTGQQLAILVGGLMIAVSLAGGLLMGGRRRKSADR